METPRQRWAPLSSDGGPLTVMEAPRMGPLKGSVSSHLVIFSFWYDLKEGLKWF